MSRRREEERGFKTSTLTRRTRARRPTLVVATHHLSSEGRHACSRKRRHLIDLINNHLADVNYSSYHLASLTASERSHNRRSLIILLASAQIPQPVKGFESSWAHKRALHKKHPSLLQREVRKRSVARNPRNLIAGRAIRPAIETVAHKRGSPASVRRLRVPARPGREILVISLLLGAATP